MTSRRDVEKRIKDLESAAGQDVTDLDTSQLYIECLKRGMDGKESDVTGDPCEEYQRRLARKHGQPRDGEAEAETDTDTEGDRP